MFRIVKKEPLNPSVTRMSIDAPMVAKKVQPGQFIILRVEENGERIPLTVAGYDREAGTVDIIFLPALPFDQKQTYGFEDLLTILRRLRAPDGCPWDREQTHESLKKDLREECYELMDAIDEKSDEHIIEECGDVLMNILFHPLIGEEQGRYDDRDVTTEVVRKLIYRHPHVFGKVKVSSSEEVLKNWDALKEKEKGQQTVTATLRSVPRSFPALLRCQKVQKKARKVGFDFETAADAFYKIAEETEELRGAMASGQGIEKEMGDLFFATMNVCRLLGFDGEETLHQATDKFIRRFEQMEKNIDAAGKKLSEMTLACSGKPRHSEVDQGSWFIPAPVPRCWIYGLVQEQMGA